MVTPGWRLPEIDERKVSILIGSDRPDIIDINSEVKKGAIGQPYVANTPLGWTVYGPIGGSNNDRIHVNFLKK